MHHAQPLAVTTLLENERVASRADPSLGGWASYRRGRLESSCRVVVTWYQGCCCRSSYCIYHPSHCITSRPTASLRRHHVRPPQHPRGLTSGNCWRRAVDIDQRKPLLLYLPLQLPPPLPPPSLPPTPTCCVSPAALWQPRRCQRSVRPFK
jgi:hypothetical protein